MKAWMVTLTTLHMTMGAAERNVWQGRQVQYSQIPQNT
jgi:hypothetical protein